MAKRKSVGNFTTWRWLFILVIAASVLYASRTRVARIGNRPHPQPMPQFPPDPDTGVPTLSGDWPEKLSQGGARRLHLEDLGYDCVVVQTPESLEVERLGADVWQTIAQIAFPHHDIYGTPAMYWATGDVDGDGSDEIVTCRDSLVTRFHWIGDRFRARNEIFPYVVDQVQIGDVENDGSNELAFFCEDSAGSSFGHPYHVCIASWRDTNLTVLWDDNTSLGYNVANMPDFLLCIADVANVGYNQVLVSKSQSDVSPTRFNLLTWNDKAGDLELAKSFAIHDKLELLPEKQEDTMPGPWESGPLHPFVIDDTTWLLSWYWQGGPRILRIEGESLVASLPRFRNLPEVGSLFLDPDGKGTGLLIPRGPIVSRIGIVGRPPQVLKPSRFRFFRL